MARRVFAVKTDGWFLLQSGYAASTLKAYRRAVRQFLEWCQLTNVAFSDIRSADQLDDLLTDYFHYLYECFDGGGRQRAANTLSGIRMLLPRLGDGLTTAAHVLRRWRRLVPPESYPPLSWELAVMIAVQMVRSGSYRFGVAVLLSFDCLLRVSEMAALRREDVIDVADDRFGADFKQTLLHVRAAKTGPHQSVAVRDAAVVSLLRGLLADTPSGGHLFPGGVSAYRRLFNSVRDSLGLSSRYGTHSLRHGGATRLHLQKVPVEDILLRGRWKSHQSARTYIQMSAGLLAAMAAPKGIIAAARVLSKDVSLSLPLVRSLSLSQRH